MKKLLIFTDSSYHKDRRFGFERRYFSYTDCIPERRKIADRRNGEELCLKRDFDSTVRIKSKINPIHLS